MSETECSDLRYFNLRIKGSSISPCIISYNYQAKNSMLWNGEELKECRKYWFDILGKSLKEGDRIEVISSDPTSGEILKITTLEIIEISKTSLRLLELAQTDFRFPKKKELEECPTCHRPL